jgi:hypothetical protein
MSTRPSSFLEHHFRPRLVTALLRVAVIGAWRGPSIVDDNDDLSDVEDFVRAAPVRSAPRPSAVRVLRDVSPASSPVSGPGAQSSAPVIASEVPEEPGHSVAA